jgi:hypothetical protein
MEEDDSSSESSAKQGRRLSGKLRELQGSFELSGFFISDERMLQYEAEFEEMKKRGEVDAIIQSVIRKSREQ